ncbi:MULTISPECIES: methyltransferase domain-containing protein [Streptomyces]|uniref:Protein-L-isoaspartate O-methyltransferase n=1 Tax=Streptomyces venezuelae (strain ATCC 10712 / CBS 650.69 / DSM 40230 / JCM 4526 / NBRC 13096 / PD 04745) TaxID=953739 RepID=F2R2J1_STRVP|nr:methyltransferase domain-containing protein [Streptomyces venezuelae]APE21680.1 methyltransferase [Streptomyces venezuelae]QER99063.1 methyltransferase domain-containing protein [Streptomyces venezuelae ATCC 10712]CCA55740.1 Protein-L-isoaspartate O-methyltransferase [Streptomyces venezuelae ATCC 10712]
MGERRDEFAEAGARARRALVREVEAAGELTDPAWRAAFAEVPRHLFVPYYYVPGTSGYERLWSGDPDPARRARWLRGAYEDTAIATRVRDGELVSSASQPSLMALMLRALDVRDGDDVLEIGAGTGYHAALLCHRLGEEHVTTVDLDEEIAESARTHLAAAGYRPAVVAVDGARGCPERAPYDRIVATCAVPSVPYAWLAQCAPGALVLAPLSTGLLLLRVEDGGRAEGRFLATSAYFVALRGAAARAPRHGPAGDERFRFFQGLVDPALDRSEALSLWLREGRPGRERFGVTVSGDRQWAWLDDPGGPYAWPLPDA